MPPYRMLVCHLTLPHACTPPYRMLVRHLTACLYVVLQEAFLDFYENQPTNSSSNKPYDQSKKGSSVSRIFPEIRPLSAPIMAASVGITAIYLLGNVSGVSASAAPELPSPIGPIEPPSFPPIPLEIRPLSVHLMAASIGIAMIYLLSRAPNSGP